MALIRALLRDRTGATAIEYGFLVALVALGLVTALTSIGGTVSNTMGNANAGFERAD